jgi:hypothetical protein
VSIGVVCLASRQYQAEWTVKAAPAAVLDVGQASSMLAGRVVGSPAFGAGTIMSKGQLGHMIVGSIMLFAIWLP